MMWFAAHGLSVELGLTLLGDDVMALLAQVRRTEPRLCPACRDAVVPDEFVPLRISGRQDGGICLSCWANALEEYSREAYLDWLKKLAYPGYLKTPHWQRVRERTFARAGYRCQVCNSGQQLRAHHRTYERLGEELPEDTTTLCARCHSLFHAANGKGSQ